MLPIIVSQELLLNDALDRCCVIKNMISSSYHGNLMLVMIHMLQRKILKIGQAENNLFKDYYYDAY